MTQKIYIFFFVCVFSIKILFGQVTVEDCYDSFNAQKSDFKKVSLNSITDKRLKIILQPFFLLGPDYSEQYFFNYKPIYVNHDSAYFNIEKGLAKGYEVKITLKRFDPLKHSFIKRSDGAICFIDEKKFWGTDGGMPSVEIDHFEIK